jgi:nucleotide-binding universal stress UspA family protein
MALKDLLVHVDNSKACAARVDAAVRVAQSHGAHLTGVHIVPRLYIPGYAEMQVPGEVIEAQRQALKARAAEAETAFKSASDKAGVSAEWRSTTGDPVSTLALHGRYVDALIVGQPDKNDPMSTSQGLAEIHWRSRIVGGAGADCMECKSRSDSCYP